MALGVDGILIYFNLLSTITKNLWVGNYEFNFLLHFYLTLNDDKQYLNIHKSKEIWVCMCYYKIYLDVPSNTQTKDIS